MLPSVPLPPAAEAVLKFLESAGKRSEAEFYLRLFLEVPKQSFALIAAFEPVVREAAGSLAEQLRFLAELGLRAPLIIVTTTAKGGPKSARTMQRALTTVGLTPVFAGFDQPDLAKALGDALQREQVPLLLAAETEPFEAVGRLARELESRKIVVVRAKGGLGPHGMQRIDLSAGHSLDGHAGGISVVNLRSDYHALLQSGLLKRADQSLLEALSQALNTCNTHRTTASVASPLNLLGELFTVRGTGTLVKLGSSIREHESYQTLDVARLTRLLESSFKRALKADFFARPPLGAYVEEEYRGAAIVEAAPSGPYLSKLAVEPVAQGEGIGQDLWRALLRKYPKLFWRSRRDNPILSWYMTVCDGFHHQGDWTLLWRGFDAPSIPSLVHEATSRPEDFRPA